MVRYLWLRNLHSTLSRTPLPYSPNASKIQPIDAHLPTPLFPKPNKNPDLTMLEIPRRRRGRIYPILEDDPFAGESTIHALSDSESDAGDTARVSNNDATPAHVNTVARAPTSPCMPVVILVHYGLSSSHHPSHQA